MGRFLEHSRIIRFGEPGRDDTEYVIGSADMMPRNLDRRVEAMLRVPTSGCAPGSTRSSTLDFADDTLAWTLEADGTWFKVPVVRGLDAEVALQDLAIARTKARSVDT